MSITFSITNTPTHVTATYPCQCVDHTPDGKPYADCPYCNGAGKEDFEEPSWPWVNMSNTNAFNILRAIGVNPVDYGSWEGETLDHAIKGCLIALNSESRRAVATRESSILPGGHAGVQVVHDGNVARMERMGAEARIGGYTDERVRVRVSDILGICRKAKKEGEKVTWG